MNHLVDNSIGRMAGLEVDRLAEQVYGLIVLQVDWSTGKQVEKITG